MVVADARTAPLSSETSLPGVSVVIPVHNGAAWLDRVVTAIESQAYAGLLEIIAVEDGSTDGSRDLLMRAAASGRVTVIDGHGRGAAAAVNAGIRAASHPLIAQIDQDVIVDAGWLIRLVKLLDDPAVAAAQGHYVADVRAGLWSRVLALDLRARYATRPTSATNHICTGNSVYRRSALVEVGLFDEALGYGYDNDMSYRLIDAGYRLLICPAATSVHLWRDDLIGHARQQYGFGYGRLDLVVKHAGRVTGDDVSGLAMMLHAPAMALALVLLVGAALLATTAQPWQGVATTGAVILGTLAAERLWAGMLAARRFHDAAGWWFAPVHLVRDVAWAAAIAVWLVRRMTGTHTGPADSMHPREEGLVR